MLRGIKPWVFAGSVLVKLSYNAKCAHGIFTVKILCRCLSQGFWRGFAESYPQTPDRQALEGGSVAGFAVFLTPLAEFDHLSAGNLAWLRFGLERIGR